MIQRELKRQNLVMKYAEKRASLKEQIKQTSFLKEKLALHRKLQQLPRNSAAVRLHNRCMITGRPKGYYRDFGLSRHVLREMAHEGLLPGVQKSSCKLLPKKESYLYYISREFRPFFKFRVLIDLRIW